MRLLFITAEKCNGLGTLGESRFNPRTSVESNLNFKRLPVLAVFAQPIRLLLLDQIGNRAFNVRTFHRMPAQHGQPNRSHLTGERGFKALLEIRNLALVKRVKFRQQAVGRLRLRQRFPFRNLLPELRLGCAAYAVFR